MSRRKVTKTTGRRDESLAALMYKGSFLIDPNNPPDRQEYRVCGEIWADDASKAFRHELESPIHRSLNELSGSGRYSLLFDRTAGLKVGQEAANRLILSISIYSSTIDSDFIVADLIGLLISFTTIAPGETGIECGPIARDGYRLDLSVGHLAGDYVTLFGPTGRECVKLFAHGDIFNYESPVNTRLGAGRIAGLGEDISAGKTHSESGCLDRLNKTVEYVDAFRSKIKDELQRNLNDYLATQDPRTAVAKNDIASYINSIIDRLGFAIEYQGKQCNLNVTAGKKDQKGRFRLTPITTRVHLTAPSNLSELLPLRLIDSLSLNASIQSDLPEESSTKWREQVGQAPSSSQSSQTSIR